MTVRQPRYSKEEFARCGNEIYESQVREQVEEGNKGRIVVIDIETGAFEVADTPMVAVDRLYERESDAQPWVIRIGQRAVFRFGSRSLRKTCMIFGAVNVAASDAEPLVGMGLLYDFELQIDAVEGGMVKIEALR